MRIDIITLFPELLRSPFEASIVKRAIEGGKSRSALPRST
jgi:tRNA G37 N-methylase TrmD